MDEFEEDLYDDDDAVNAPLDVRFVIPGLSMLILGLALVAFAQIGWPKYLGIVALIASLFVVTKKKKDNMP